MRKILGPVLLGLGGFLLIAGLLGLVWAPGVVKKTPLQVETVTYLDGEAGKIDTSTGDLVENPIYAISDTRTDTELSTDDTVAWVSSSCVMIDRGEEPECVDGSEDMITASVDVFASDRVTALADNESLDLPADAVPHEGLINKFPFDTEKKTYPYWDGTTGQAVEAVYDRTEDLQGTETYVFTVNVDEAPIDIAEGTPGTYTTAKEIYVEPQTGAILNQTEDQQRYLENGTPVLDLQLAFTEDQITQSLDDNAGDRLLLDALTVWLPIVGFVGGALALVAGFLLMRGGKRSGNGHARQRKPVPAGR
ncbi:hypothetical protein I601_3658 [Nocardioides dokdonensis FR1436]|uniref:DUF3068 domain-containing protein n=1 Tax=Nocardioides dokdonensis FR1436 TaxID=1300347 RepID=A0A1A9GP37_9ACTN|nr:DUF3068 domain-containing protein [Nocardioides dokdonensis]ANH40064.1 hypothetical protein I601_3658 [Nocardioides dokdonensis FR1436]